MKKTTASMIRLALLMSLAVTCATLLHAGRGCAAIGVIADKMPRPPVKAKYELAGKRTAVMVWADRGITIDRPSIQLDLAASVANRIEQGITAKNPPVRDARIDPSPESIVRWQKDNPAHDALPVTVFAPALATERLIYIEVTRLSTRTAQSFVLYRGSATASVKVVEINPDLTARVAWEVRDLSVNFPRKGNEDGTPKGSDDEFYVGTIRELADEIAKLFIEHPAED
jgi:hypothetical protein